VDRCAGNPRSPGRKPAARCQCLASGLVRDGRFFRSGPASLNCAPVPRPFKERPSSRFRGISLLSKRRTAAVFHGRPDP
jgi:hypothetical protein